MKQQKAFEIIESLIAGTDPITGDDLPPGSVLQHADVMRALLASKAAMVSQLARDKRRAQLPAKVGKAWTEKEESKLTELFNSGEPWRSIAARLGRTQRAIAARLQILKLITPEQGAAFSPFAVVGKKKEGEEDGSGILVPPDGQQSEVPPASREQPVSGEGH